jgi:hypothetical protein
MFGYSPRRPTPSGYEYDLVSVDDCASAHQLATLRCYFTSCFIDVKSIFRQDLGESVQEAARSTTGIKYTAAKSLGASLTKRRNKAIVEATEPPHLVLHLS